MHHIIVYQTDPSGIFLHEITAHEFGLEEGTFNIPNGAYTDAPPKPKAGRWPLRVDGAWVLVEDFRAVPLWVTDTAARYVIGSTHETATGPMQYPGWGPLPAWLTIHRPEPLDQ
jgi:hypothetical protein